MVLVVVVVVAAVVAIVVGVVVAALVLGRRTLWEPIVLKVAVCKDLTLH